MQEGLVTVVPQFDAQASRYQCCCFGCCRSTTCATIIGFLELLGVIGILVVGILNYTRSGNIDKTSLISAAVTFGVWFLVICMLFYGICQERAGWLIPHMIIQILAMIELLILIGLVAWLIWASQKLGKEAASNHMSNIIQQSADKYGSNYGINGTAVQTWFSNAQNDKEFNNAVSFFGNVATLVLAIIEAACCIFFLIEIWFFCNIRRCYNYLKDKVIAEQVAEVVAATATPMQATPVYDADFHQGYNQGYNNALNQAYANQVYANQPYANSGYGYAGGRL